MKKRILSLLLALVLLTAVLPLGVSAGAADGQWVSAWSTSPVRAGLSEMGALNRFGVTLTAVSSRVAVEPAVSGAKVRLVFSNEYGICPLTISACTVAASCRDTRSVDTKSLKDVSFSGKRSVTIPAGRTVTSDPVAFPVTVGNKITVTTFFRGINTQRTVGLIGGDTYAAVGDHTRSRTMLLGLPLRATADSGAYEVIPALKGIEVLASGEKCSCVIFGDSTVANEIPRLLEKRLQDNGITNISVIQQAIKGNRLVADGIGVAAGVLGEAGVERFERDVLSQAGVKYVIVKLGVNDLVHPYCKSKASRLSPVTFEEMTAGYTALAAMAHEKGVKIFFAELSPWKGYTRNLLGLGDDVHWTKEIDALRLRLNEWMASGDCPADAFLSFPELASPGDPYALKGAYTTDGAHLTSAGQKALVNAIDLDIFTY